MTILYGQYYWKSTRIRVDFSDFCGSYPLIELGVTTDKQDGDYGEIVHNFGFNKTTQAYYSLFLGDNAQDIFNKMISTFKFTK